MTKIGISILQYVDSLRSVLMQSTGRWNCILSEKKTKGSDERRQGSQACSEVVAFVEYGNCIIIGCSDYQRKEISSEKEMCRT